MNKMQQLHFMTGDTYLKTFVSEFSAEYTETSSRFDNFAAVILSCFSTPYHSTALKVITVFFKHLLSQSPADVTSVLNKERGSVEKKTN